VQLARETLHYQNYQIDAPSFVRAIFAALRFV
jgi:hypothetical protein